MFYCRLALKDKIEMQEGEVEEDKGKTTTATDSQKERTGKKDGQRAEWIRFTSPPQKGIWT
jgi:hypothetical protein